MNVTAEKLEEIYKVYDEKRIGKISTNDVGTPFLRLSQTHQICSSFPHLARH